MVPQHIPARDPGRGKGREVAPAAAKKKKKKKRKAEDEDENEDDGCRRGCVPATDYHPSRAEMQKMKVSGKQG
jgi:hypothetical protein